MDNFNSSSTILCALNNPSACLFSASAALKRYSDGLFTVPLLIIKSHMEKGGRFTLTGRFLNGT